jgi:hypothetical protein
MIKRLAQRESQTVGVPFKICVGYIDYVARTA